MKSLTAHKTILKLYNSPDKKTNWHLNRFLEEYALHKPSIPKLEDPKYIEDVVAEEEPLITTLDSYNVDEVVFNEDRAVVVEVSKVVAHPLF